MSGGHIPGKDAMDSGLREEIECIIRSIKIFEVKTDVVLYSLQAEGLYPPPAAEMKKLNAEHVAYENPWRKHSLQGSKWT